MSLHNDPRYPSTMPLTEVMESERREEALDDAYAEGRKDEREVSAELLAALQAILALDDGDNPDLWHFEAEFEAGRAAVSKALGEAA